MIRQDSNNYQNCRWEVRFKQNQSNTYLKSYNLNCTTLNDESCIPLLINTNKWIDYHSPNSRTQKFSLNSSMWHVSCYVACSSKSTTTLLTLARNGVIVETYRAKESKVTDSHTKWHEIDSSEPRTTLKLRKKWGL